VQPLGGLAGHGTVGPLQGLVPRPGLSDEFGRQQVSALFAGIEKNCRSVHLIRMDFRSMPSFLLNVQDPGTLDILVYYSI
jgi:hypothetical protein